MAMAKKGLRKIHIDGDEWHYKVDMYGSASVFPPNSKQCVLTVVGKETERGLATYRCVSPSLVKRKIEEYLEKENGR